MAQIIAAIAAQEREIEMDEQRVEAALQALEELLDSLDQLHGSGPFVINHEFCQVPREEARAALAKVNA